MARPLRMGNSCAPRAEKSQRRRLKIGLFVMGWAEVQKTLDVRAVMIRAPFGANTRGPVHSDNNLNCCLSIQQLTTTCPQNPRYRLPNHLQTTCDDQQSNPLPPAGFLLTHSLRPSLPQETTPETVESQIKQMLGTTQKLTNVDPGHANPISPL